MVNQYELFNRKIVEFIENLIYIFPEVNDFKVFKTACDWAIGMDVTSAQQIFNICVGQPYEVQIMEKDEKFFLKENYDEYNDYIKLYGNDMNLVEKLKNIWSIIDESNKEVIWQYMQVLIFLNKRCLQK